MDDDYFGAVMNGGTLNVAITIRYVYVLFGYGYLRLPTMPLQSHGCALLIVCLGCVDPRLALGGSFPAKSSLPYNFYIHISH